MTFREFKRRRRDLMRIKISGAGVASISHEDLSQTGKYKRLMKIMTIEAKDLKDILDYNQETGTVFWKVRKEHSPYWTQRAALRFNKVNAGKQVGTVRKLPDGTSQIHMKLPDGKSYLLHRVIYALMTGEWPTRMITHKNGDRTDNRWKNLKESDQGELNRKAKIRSDNTTGIKGVSWIESRGYYEVRTTSGRSVKTQTTDTLEEAVKIKNSQLKAMGFEPLKEEDR
jgi:hypothetical protein